MEFLKDFVAVVRCLADGNSPIGYLRRDGEKIHRRSYAETNEGVVRPPQRACDEREEASWRENEATDYAL